MSSIFFDGVEYKSFDHLYAVSRCGKVLRKSVPYFYFQHRKDGYIAVGRQRLLHRMVAICWVENQSTGKHVHHKDHNKHNNNADNLEWLSPKAHNQHHNLGQKRSKLWSEESRQKLAAFRRTFKASEESKAKMRANLDNVRRQRKCVIDGTEYSSIKDAAKEFNVSRGCIIHRIFSKHFPNYNFK